MQYPTGTMRMNISFPRKSLTPDIYDDVASNWQFPYNAIIHPCITSSSGWMMKAVRWTFLDNDDTVFTVNDSVILFLISNLLNRKTLVITLCTGYQHIVAVCMAMISIQALHNCTCKDYLLSSFLWIRNRYVISIQYYSTFQFISFILSKYPINYTGVLCCVYCKCPR